MNLAGRSLLLAALLLAAPGAWSQQAAAAVWHGVVRNPAGAPIAGARIRLAAKGASEQVTTGADGQFRLATLPAGQYRLFVEVHGRKGEFAQAIDLAAGAPAVLITFSGRGELAVAELKGQTGTGGEQLSSQAVSELPLNKRDFSTLLLLAAGTMTDTNGAANFTAQFAINGQRGVEAVFAMDGADISDPEMGGATFSNFNVRGEIVPYIRLRDHFNIRTARPDLEQIMIVETEEGRYGFVVDQVLGDCQTVIKNLGRFYRHVQVVSGATILGNGTVALILDPFRLVQDAMRLGAEGQRARAAPHRGAARQPSQPAVRAH